MLEIVHPGIPEDQGFHWNNATGLPRVVDELRHILVRPDSILQEALSIHFVLFQRVAQENKVTL